MEKMEVMKMKVILNEDPEFVAKMRAALQKKEGLVLREFNRD